MEYREINKADDIALADIVRRNLKAHGLDIPGTVYFDDNLDHLSDFYLGDKARRYYFIAVEDDEVVGGVGLAEFEYFEDCAELQKLYLTDQVKGKGIGYQLIRMVEEKARERGIHLVWVSHDLFDPRVISRQGVRDQINSYMRTVMQEEPVDPSLENLDDAESW